MQIPMAVRRFASDVVAPKVREMDEKELMDPAIIKGLFQQGVLPVFLIGVTGSLIANL